MDVKFKKKEVKREMKRFGTVISGVVIILFLAVSIGISADVPETVKIDIIQKAKPPVVLPHKAHIDNKIACKSCHHTNKADEKPAKCESCHDKEKDDGKKIAIMGNPATSTSKGIFHITCVTCHKEEKAKNAASKAPTMCPACHKG